VYILICIIIIGFLSYVLLARRRKPIVQNKKALKIYRRLLSEQVDYYSSLSPAEKKRFENLLTEFLTDVNIEGVGTAITDLDKVLIASSAIIPIFGLGDWKYNNLTNVILYPDTFDKEFQFEGGHRNIMGMVGSGYMNGQMLLSRAALVKGFSTQHGTENAAIHEFVHLLDGADGATDGLPERLLAHQYAKPWLHLMHVEMHKIADGKSDINPYALTNEAEFFAVAAEYFFEKPELLQVRHPDLYHLLSEIFEQRIKPVRGR
jgi:Mlc titration factor MtfA (ptsG expression regulator)